MITSPRRPTLSPHVTRHFQFTRIQDQLIALALSRLGPDRVPPFWNGRSLDAVKTNRLRQGFKVFKRRPGELDPPCPITISVWRSTPESPRNNRPRRIRSTASLRPSCSASASDALVCDPEMRLRR